MPHRDATLDQETADLIDYAGPLAHKARADAMESEQVHLLRRLDRHKVHGRPQAAGRCDGSPSRPPCRSGSALSCPRVRLRNPAQPLRTRSRWHRAIPKLTSPPDHSIGAGRCVQSSRDARAGPCGCWRLMAPPPPTGTSGCRGNSLSFRIFFGRSFLILTNSLSWIIVSSISD